MGFVDYLKIDSKILLMREKVSILRHDVDLLPEELFLQKIQAKVDVFGTYNFRTQIFIKAGMKE